MNGLILLKIVTSGISHVIEGTSLEHVFWFRAQDIRFNLLRHTCYLSKLINNPTLTPPTYVLYSWPPQGILKSGKKGKDVARPADGRTWRGPDGLKGFRIFDMGLELYAHGVKVRLA